MNNKYDIGIIGGGLAGLALSIQLARVGYSVVLFEKEQYPFHRVCGEYISMESWNFLVSLGVDLPGMDVPVIRQLLLSGKNGKSIQTDLSLGGFGLSRYTLDAILAGLAKKEGVTVMENARVDHVRFERDEFTIESGHERCCVKIAAGCFGKRSNLDVKWKRRFIVSKKNRLNNYVGVKYHVTYPGFPSDTIGLHLFRNGYCGIVRVDRELYNLCYLTSARNLRDSNGSVEEMERDILQANPLLKEILSNSSKSEKDGLTISQISFDKKSQVENHVLMVGDSAGMITPLCGNGMSMALQASKMAALQIDSFLKRKITRKQMEIGYAHHWNKEFGDRLRTGRVIQSLFAYGWLTDIFISTGKRFPGLIRWIIKNTHGRGF